MDNDHNVENAAFDEGLRHIESTLGEIRLRLPQTIQIFNKIGADVIVPIFQNKPGNIDQLENDRIMLKNEKEEVIVIRTRDLLYRALLEINLTKEDKLSLFAIYTNPDADLPSPKEFFANKVKVEIPSVVLTEGKIEECFATAVRVIVNDERRTFSYGTLRYRALIDANYTQIRNELDLNIPSEKHKKTMIERMKSLFSFTAKTQKDREMRRRIFKSSMIIAGLVGLGMGSVSLYNMEEKYANDELPLYETINAHQNTLIVPIYNESKKPNLTEAEIKKISKYVHDFYLSQSYGNVNFEMSEIPWQKINSEIGYSNHELNFDDVIYATQKILDQNNIRASNYNTIITITPTIVGNKVLGSAYKQNFKLPGRAQIASTGDISFDTYNMLHEMGHTLGFSHSYLENNPTPNDYSDGFISVTPPVNANDATVTAMTAHNTDQVYLGNDIMGSKDNSDSNDISICYKVWAGWIKKDNIQTIVPSKVPQIVTLTHLEVDKPKGTMAARIKKPDTGDHYYISYNHSYEKDLNGNTLGSGIRVHKWHEPINNTVDFTPPIQLHLGKSIEAVVLHEGDVFIDQVNKIYFKVTSMKNDEAQIEILDDIREIFLIIPDASSYVIRTNDNNKLIKLAA